MFISSSSHLCAEQRFTPHIRTLEVKFTHTGPFRIHFYGGNHVSSTLYIKEAYSRRGRQKTNGETHLPGGTFTHYSEAWHTTSWLDHCISTSDGDEIINSISIDYSLNNADHLPVCIDLALQRIPEIVVDNSTRQRGLAWDKIKINDDDRAKYCDLSDANLLRIPIPHDALRCIDANCTNVNHRVGAFSPLASSPPATGPPANGPPAKSPPLAANRPPHLLINAIHSLALLFSLSNMLSHCCCVVLAL